VEVVPRVPQYKHALVVAQSLRCLLGYKVTSPTFSRHTSRTTTPTSPAATERSLSAGGAPPGRPHQPCSARPPSALPLEHCARTALNDDEAKGASGGRFGGGGAGGTGVSPPGRPVELAGMPARCTGEGVRARAARSILQTLNDTGLPRRLRLFGGGAARWYRLRLLLNHVVTCSRGFVDEEPGRELGAMRVWVRVRVAGHRLEGELGKVCLAEADGLALVGGLLRDAQLVLPRGIRATRDVGVGIKPVQHEVFLRCREMLPASKLE
jgi:hypothetical protein